MTPSLAWTPTPPPRLPLALGLGIAVLLHLILLALFLGREPSPAPTSPPPPLPVLQIDLTPREDRTPPERPEMLAEHTQRTEETSAARAPELDTILRPKPAQAIHSPTPAAPRPVQPTRDARIDPPTEARAATPPRQQAPRPERKPAETAPKRVEQAAPQEKLSMTELGLRSARLHAEILEQGLRNDVAARSKVLSANTVAGPEAAYLRAWVEKVERIGNIHYPDEARRRKLSGRLVLEVIVNAWGDVESVRVRQSSGEPVLDQAAKDIVLLAAPYAPFPSELRAAYDQFTIVRTWAFVSGGSMSTR